MPTATLDDRALIDVTGTDAEPFLQNLITCDLGVLEAGELRPGALLSPQGKILFDFLIGRQKDGFVIDVADALAADLVKRLTLYRLRAKVKIGQLDQGVVQIGWQSDSLASQRDSTASRDGSPASEGDSANGTYVDIRFPPELAVRRRYGTHGPAANAEGWTALRVAHAVPESGLDFAAGDAFPHDVLYDQNGGVGFKKGCFVGQEVVSRMQHRGTARRRLLVAEAASPLPAPGTPVTAGGRPIGSLGTTAGTRGLALVRIDKAKDAMDAGEPILADGVQLALSIPAWARFTFPTQTAEEA